MAFNNYKERSYEKGATESASSVADTIIEDLKGQGVSLGSIDFYSSRFTLIVISKKGDTDDTIIVGQSTTFPDRLSIKVDDTVSEEHRADSIGYIDEDVNGAQTFKLFEEAGSLAAFKAALTTAAEGDVEKVTLRVSPTLTPEYTNPKFKGGSVSFADLNLEGKRQDLIVLRMEESRGLFGSRDTTADPIRVDTSFPPTDTIRREGELFVLTHEEGGTTTQSEGLYVSQEYETDDLDADGNKIKAFRWIYATDPERTAALFAFHKRYGLTDIKAHNGVAPQTVDEQTFIQGLSGASFSFTPHLPGDNHSFGNDNVTDVEIRGFGDIEFETPATTEALKMAFELVTLVTGETDADAPVLASSDVILPATSGRADGKVTYNIPIRDFISASVPSSSLRGKRLGFRINVTNHNDGPIQDVTSHIFKYIVNQFHVVVSQQHLHLYGSPGPSGPAGEVGPAGPAGEQGETGERGNRGSQGATGHTGSRGPQGLSGSSGRPGPQGTVGPAGPPGQDGQDGEDGAAGAAGSNARLDTLVATTESSVLNGEPDFENELTPSFSTTGLTEEQFKATFLGTNKTNPVQIVNIPKSYMERSDRIPFTHTNFIPWYNYNHSIVSTGDDTDVNNQHGSQQASKFNYLISTPSEKLIKGGLPITDIRAENQFARSVNMFFFENNLFGIGKDVSSGHDNTVEQRYRFIIYSKGQVEGREGDHINYDVGLKEVTLSNAFDHHMTSAGGDNNNRNAGVKPVVLTYKDNLYLVRSINPAESHKLAISKIVKTGEHQIGPLYYPELLAGHVGDPTNPPVTGLSLQEGTQGMLSSSRGGPGTFNSKIKSWVVGRNYVYVIAVTGYYKIPIETFFSSTNVDFTAPLVYTRSLFDGEARRDQQVPTGTEEQESKAGFILEEENEYVALQGNPFRTTHYTDMYGKRFTLSHGAYTELELKDSANDNALITKTDIPVGAVSEVRVDYGSRHLTIQENVGGKINEVKGDITSLVNSSSLVGEGKPRLGFSEEDCILSLSPITSGLLRAELDLTHLYFDVENDVLTVTSQRTISSSGSRAPTPITNHIHKYTGSLIKITRSYDNSLYGAFYIESILSTSEEDRTAPSRVYRKTVRLRVAIQRMNFSNISTRSVFASAPSRSSAVNLTPMQQRVIDISEYQKKSDVAKGVEITYGTANPNGISLGQYDNDFVFTTGGSVVIERESDDPAVATAGVQNTQRVMQTTQDYPAVLWGNGDNLELWVSVSQGSADMGFPVSQVYPESISVTIDDNGTPRTVHYNRSGPVSQQSATIQAGGGRLINVNTQNYTRSNPRTPNSSSLITNISSTGGPLSLGVSKGNVVGEEGDLYAHLVDESKVDVLYAYRGDLWEKLSNPGRPSHRSVSVPINAYTGTGRTRSLEAYARYTMYTKAATTGQQENLIEDNFWTQPESSEPPPHTPSSSSLAFPKKAYLWAYVPCKSETHNLSGEMSIDVRTRVAPSSGTRSSRWERKMKLRYEYYAIGEKTGVPLFTKTSERHATYTGVVEGDEIITEFSQDQSGGFDEKNIRCKIDLAKYFTVPDLAKTQGVLIKIYLGSAIRTADYTATDNFLRTEDTVLFPTGNGFTFNYEDPEE